MIAPAAFELPYALGLSPTVAGLLVGSITGVVGFILVVLLVQRKPPPRRALAYAAPEIFAPAQVSMREMYTTPPPFTPSTEALAWAHTPSSEIPVEVEGDDEEDVLSEPEPGEAVSVMPVVVISSRPPSFTEESAPHPLGIIRGISTSVAHLDLDDGPTQIAETVFDEPPRPRTRGSRPEIRPKAPSQPRESSPIRLPEVRVPRPRHP